ncbi:putative ribonuclease H-like domain-containing protein [Tanacetum coccineum]
MDSFQELTPKSLSSWHRSLTLNSNFYDHVSFHLKCEIYHAAGGKLCDKNANESWEIIENLVLYDHEGWNDSKEFVKPVKVISISQRTSKMPDQRLFELEDQINFLLKGSRPTPRPNSTHVPQAYVEANRGRKNIVNNGVIDESIVEPRKSVEEKPLKVVDETKEVDDKLGITEDTLVDVAGYVYPVDFVILDIKEDEKRHCILGTPFLTTAKAVIKFDKGTITLRSGKSKISFHRIPKSLCKIERGIKNEIEPIAPTMTVNKLVLKWEERIKFQQEKEMEFDPWRSKTFKNKHPTLVKVENEVNDKGKFFKENEIFTVAGDGVKIYPDGVIFDKKKLGSFIGRFLENDLTSYRMFLLHY